MKIKIGNVDLILNALLKIKNEKMSALTAFKIVKDINILTAEQVDINKSITSIALKYCIKDENENPIIEDEKYKFEPDIIQTVNDELKELTEAELDLNLLTIKVDELANMSLTPVQMNDIFEIVEE